MVARGLWALGRAIGILFRMPLVGISIAVALIGVASVGQSNWTAMAAVAGVASLFHICVFVLNDVIDIDVDRRHPRRTRSPLVLGTVKRQLAIAIAVCALIGAFAVDQYALGFHSSRTFALAIAFIGLIGYDIMGKRARVPPVTDALQGAGWAALLYYGALSAGSPSKITLLAALYLAIATILISGVHGGLRDVVPDLDSGARTSAIFFGARPRFDGVTIPAGLVCYGWALQFAMATVVAVGIGWGEPKGSWGWVSGGIAMAFIVLSGVLLAAGLRTDVSTPRRFLVGSAHIITSFGAFSFLASVYASPLLGLLILCVMALPLTVNSWFRAVFYSLIKGRTKMKESLAS